MPANNQSIVMWYLYLCYDTIETLGGFIMSKDSNEKFREQLRALVDEFEKKGVSLQMIMEYVNSMKSKN